MLFSKSSAAYALAALALTLTPGHAEPGLLNTAYASNIKDLVAGLRRQGSSADLGDTGGTPRRRTDSRTDLKRFFGDLKAGKLFRKKKDVSAAEGEVDWRKSILNKPEEYHGANAELMKGRKYGSLPPLGVSGPMDMAVVDKARKAARKKNVYTKETSQTGLGQGLGLPPYREKALSRKDWAYHQQYSASFEHEKYKQKAEQLAREKKPPMEAPFRAPNTPKPKYLEFESHDPQKEAAWQQHATKHADMISAGRGDAAFNHKFYNTDVTNEPRMARQSFTSRDSSQEVKAHQKFDMHNRQSLPSDGRWGGEGSLLGKSPLAMGAEGPRSKSLLAKDDPNYRPGMYSGPLRGTASEQDDVQSTMHKPQSRIEKWQQQRLAAEKAAGKKRAAQGAEMKLAGDAGPAQQGSSAQPSRR